MDYFVLHLDFTFLLLEYFLFDFNQNVLRYNALLSAINRCLYHFFTSLHSIK